MIKILKNLVYQYFPAYSMVVSITGNIGRDFYAMYFGNIFKALLRQ